MTEVHPVVHELIPSVVYSIFRRYKNFTEKDDLSQEAWSWVSSRVDKINKDLIPDEEEQSYKEKRIAWQMKRHLERYARKEKARKSGYNTQDEAFYDTITIAQLLPYVIASIVNDTALEQAQNLINDGTPRKPSAPAEGGNLLAILIDIKKAYLMIEKPEQDILRLRYHERFTLKQISQHFQCAISTAERRSTSALRKLQTHIGGQSPWQ